MNEILETQQGVNPENSPVSEQPSNANTQPSSKPIGNVPQAGVLPSSAEDGNVISIKGDDLSLISTDGARHKYKAGTKKENSEYYRYVTGEGKVFTRDCDDTAFFNAVASGSLIELRLREIDGKLSFISFRTFDQAIKRKSAEIVLEKLDVKTIKDLGVFSFA